MKFKPYKYQERAIDFVLGRPASALFLEMGLGKTVSVLTAFSDLKYDMGKAKGMLVVAPLRVALLTWAQEAKKWDHLKHLRVQVLHGPEKEWNLQTKADIYVINYDGLAWLRNMLTGKRRRLFPIKIDMIVFDESTYVKHETSIRSAIALGLAAGVERRVILTGTPSPNGLLDLWHQVKLIDMGERLGQNFSAFRSQYFFKAEYERKYNPRQGVTKMMSDKIADISLTMKAKDYLDMPDKFDNTIKVCLPEDLREQYDDLETNFFMEIDGDDITAFNAAALSMKLRQFVQGMIINTETKTVHDIHTKKLEALQDICEDSQAPKLIAIQFRHEVEMIRKQLGRDIPAIYGGTSAKDTIAYVEAWNRGELPYLIAHPASMAHGLNLQSGGSTVIWFGITWNLEHYLQLNARLYRQGQTRPVIIHHIVMEDTIDAVVLKAIRNKESSMAGLIQRLKEWRNDRTEVGLAA